MKSFVTKIIILTIVIIGLFQLVYYLFPFSILDRGYPIYRRQVEFIENPSFSPEILFLGDSRVVSGIVPNQVPNSRGLSLIGSTPIDAYYVLEKYLSKNSGLKQVFVSFAWDRMGTKYYPEVLIQRGGFYDFYSYAEFREIMQTCKRVDPEFRQLVVPGEFYMAKLKSPHLIGQKIESSRFKERSENLRIYEEFEQNNGHITAIWSKEETCDQCLASETYLTEFKIKPVCREYFTRLMQLCEDNDIRLIFETLPFNEHSFSQLAPAVKDEYKMFVEDQQKDYEIHVLDDTLFYYPDSYYEDPHHMTTEGAKAYTKYLLEKYFDQGQP